MAGVTDPKLKAELYTLAYSIVRADEGVTGAERIYLAQLAHQLGLDPAATKRLEAEADRAGRLERREAVEAPHDGGERRCPRTRSGTWPWAATRSVR